VASRVIEWPPWSHIPSRGRRWCLGSQVALVHLRWQEGLWVASGVVDNLRWPHGVADGLGELRLAFESCRWHRELWVALGVMGGLGWPQKL
jgi:hypothetical protein